MLECPVHDFPNHLKSQSVSDLDHYSGLGTLLSLAFSPVQALLTKKAGRASFLNKLLTELVFIFYKVDHTDEQDP